MKRILALILSGLAIILCSCGNENTNSNITMPALETTEAQITQADTTEAVTADTDTTLKPFEETVAQNTAKSYKDWAVGGFNYSYSEAQPLVYNGSDVVMKVYIGKNSASYECCIGVYVFVEGFPIPFSIEEFTSENFTTSVSEVSEKAVFHQISLLPGGTKYYEITFKPDMFEKGTQVFPTVVCTVNNDYYPDDFTSVISMATSIFGIFPPTVNISAEKSQNYEVCEEYKTEKMPEDYYDQNDNGFPKFEVSQVESDDESKVNIQIKGHTINDLTSKEYADQTVYVTLLVNDEPYAAFNGKQTLKLIMNKNTYYIYDVTINKSDLKDINRVQLIGVLIDHENANPPISPEPVYVSGN